MPTAAEVNKAATYFIQDTMTADAKINGAPGTVTDRHGVTTKNLEQIFKEATDINTRSPVEAWADSNITLSGLQDIDSYSPSIGDRIGVGNQSTPSENGIYIYSDSAWTRASDMDADSNIHSSNVYVNNGTTHGTRTYRFIVPDPDSFTLDADSITTFKIGDLKDIYPVVTQAEAEAGTDSAVRLWSPLRISQAIRALDSDSGAPSLNELLDVTLTAPVQGQILIYDSASSMWIDSSLSLNDLNDVLSTSPTNDQVLSYDDGSGRWVPRSIVETSTLDSLTDVDVSSTPPTDGQALVYDSASGLWVPVDQSGGASTLDSLSDVSVASATDGQVLSYDSASGLWVPVAQSGGGGGGVSTLDSLSDVNVTSATDGQVLSYDSATGTWVPVAQSGGGGGGVSTLDSLSDVDLTTTPPSNGQSLVYDSDAGSWVPGSGSTTLQYLRLTHTSADALTVNAWTTVPWTTEHYNTISGAVSDLTNNEIDLPVGTYLVDVAIPFWSAANIETRIYDVTNSQVISQGPSQNAATQFGQGEINDILEITSPISIRVEYYVDDGGNLGNGTVTGASPTVGPQIRLIKIDNIGSTGGTEEVVTQLASINFADSNEFPLDLTNIDTYDQIIIEGEDLTDDNSLLIYFRLSSDNGATFDSAGSYDRIQVGSAAGAGITQNTDHMSLLGTETPADLGRIWGRIEHHASSLIQTFAVTSHGQGNNDVTVSYNISNEAKTHNAVRFYWATNTGPINTGLFRVFGVRRVANFPTTRVQTKTGTADSVSSADAGLWTEYTSDSAITLTIDASILDLYAEGTVVQAGAGQITAVAGGTTTIKSRGSAFKTAGQEAIMAWKKTDSDVIRLAGDLTT